MTYDISVVTENGKFFITSLEIKPFSVKVHDLSRLFQSVKLKVITDGKPFFIFGYAQFEEKVEVVIEEKITEEEIMENSLNALDLVLETYTKDAFVQEMKKFEK